MKVFVTGATGFVGGHLVRVLLQKGISVKALVRDRNKADQLERMGVETVMGDTTDRGSFKGALKGCEIVYHLGNIASWWLPDKGLYYRVNVDGTKNVMFEALEGGVRKVIYTSSLAAIRQPRGEITTEETEHRGDFESHYARSKFLAERETLRIYRQYGLPVVILNPGVVIGPGDLKTFGRTVIDFLNGRLKAIPCRDSLVPIVYIDDTVEAHIAAVDKGKVGERYILVGDNIRIGDLFRMLSEITGVAVPRKTVSATTLKLIAYLLEAVSFFTGKPPKLAVDGVRAMEIGAAGCSKKAKEELGVSFTPVEEALRKTVEWYRLNGYVTSFHS